MSRSNSTIRCRSSAKINLALDVLSARADGYHELRSVVHPIGLWDELHFDFGGPESLRCNAAELEGEINLCSRAANAYRDAAGIDVPTNPVAIALRKCIPTGAGLGGGSGNAAATLLACNRAYQCFGATELEALGGRLGADVPLFLRGGCLLLEGVGERLSNLNNLDGWVVLLQPLLAASTPAVFRRWDVLAAGSAASHAHHTARMINLLSPNGLNLTAPGGAETNLLAAVAKGVHNDLRPAAEALGVPSDSLEQLLRDAGALAASMTGSGSAVFGLFIHEAAALRAFESLKETAAQRADLRPVLLAPLTSHTMEWPLVDLRSTL